MYKLLLFLKKTSEENILNHFKDFTVKYLSDVAKKEIKIAKVESSLLLDQKYSLYCDIEVESKDAWDLMMNTKEGRLLNKDLMEFHQNVTAIFVDYSS